MRQIRLFTWVVIFLNTEVWGQSSNNYDIPPEAMQAMTADEMAAMAGMTADMMAYGYEPEGTIVEEGYSGMDTAQLSSKCSNAMQADSSAASAACIALEQRCVSNGNPNIHHDADACTVLCRQNKDFVENYGLYYCGFYQSDHSCPTQNVDTSGLSYMDIDIDQMYSDCSNFGLGDASNQNLQASNQNLQACANLCGVDNYYDDWLCPHYRAMCSRSLHLTNNDQLSLEQLSSKCSNVMQDADESAWQAAGEACIALEQRYFLRQRCMGKGDYTTPDTDACVALCENSMLDVCVFYKVGFEAGPQADTTYQADFEAGAADCCSTNNLIQCGAVALKTAYRKMEQC